LARWQFGFGELKMLAPKIWVAMCALFCTSLAQAADGAKFRPLGFSNDSRYFAFEQYGVQDGSGFAYVDVFVLDIAQDNWVKGTPINIELEDEKMSVVDVRVKARSESQSLLARLGITVDAEYLASNPFTEVSKTRNTIIFHDHYNNGMGISGDVNNQGTWQLTTRDVKVPLPADCEADIGVVGYQLALKNNKSGVTKTLHKDATIPKSRFCPVAYDIEAIVQPIGGTIDNQLVAIIGVNRRGFEGADRRFIAVPFKLN
jgi:predicted secreted protein